MGFRVSALGAHELELAASPLLNVMKFTRSFIGAARQSLLLFNKATTAVSMCGERHNNVCMTGGMLLRRRGLGAHADNNPLQICVSGLPHWCTSMRFPVPRGPSVTVNRGGAAKLLAQQTLHHAGGKKKRKTRQDIKRKLRLYLKTSTRL